MDLVWLQPWLGRLWFSTRQDIKVLLYQLYLDLSFFIFFA